MCLNYPVQLLLVKYIYICLNIIHLLVWFVVLLLLGDFRVYCSLFVCFPSLECSIYFFCKPRSRISSMGTNESQDKVVKVVQTRAECYTDSMLSIPSDSQSLGAVLGLVTEPLLLTLTRLQQLCSDTACCHFVDMLVSGSIALKKVKLVAELVYKYFESFENTTWRYMLHS